MQASKTRLEWAREQGIEYYSAIVRSAETHWVCGGRASGQYNQHTCRREAKSWGGFYKHFFRGEDADPGPCWPVEWRGMKWEKDEADDSQAALRWVEKEFGKFNIKKKWLGMQY